MFHKAEFNFPKYDNSRPLVTWEIKRWLDYRDRSCRRLRNGWQPAGSSAPFPRKVVSAPWTFYADRTRMEKGASVLMLWSQALGRGGTEYTEQTEASLTARRVSGGMALRTEGQLGPSHFTSRTILCHESGHPFLTLTVPRGHMRLQPPQPWARLLWGGLGY